MHCWFYFFQVSHYCPLCFNSTSFSGAQHMCGNYYLYMNAQLVVTPNLLTLVPTEVLFVSLKIYDMITKTHKNLESFANCSITQYLYVCSSAPQHGTTSHPDHIMPIVQLCLCVGHHSCYHNTDCFDSPCTKGSSVIHRQQNLSHIFRIKRLKE